MKSHIFLALIFVQILFGINFVTSKIVVGHIPPYQFACIRFLFSGFVLLVFLKIKGIRYSLPSKRDLWWLLGLSFVGISLSQTLFLTGLKYTTSINTSIISTTIPVFTLLISWLRKQVNVNRTMIIGFAMALIGVVVLKRIEDFSLQNDGLRGDLLIMLSCFFLSSFISYSRDFFKHHPATWGTTYMFLIGGGYLLPFAIAEGNIGMETLNLPISFFYSLAFSIIGATLFTYFLNNWALTRVDPAKVSIFIYLQPVVAAFMAWYFLAEQISWREIFSICLIVAGMRIALLKKRDKGHAH